jgi:hypothetical protein
LSDEQRKKAGSPWGPANPQNLNRYSYVTNNPLRYVDPTGHEAECTNGGDGYCGGYGGPGGGAAPQGPGRGGGGGAGLGIGPAAVAAANAVKDTAKAVKDAAIRRLELLVADYTFQNVAADIVVRLRILQGRVQTDVESIRKGFIQVLEEQIALHGGKAWAPQHQVKQLEQLQSATFKLEEFLRRWGMGRFR